MEEKKKKNHIGLIIIIILLLILSVGLNICLLLFPEKIPGLSKINNANKTKYAEDVVDENIIQNTENGNSTTPNLESEENITIENTSIENTSVIKNETSDTMIIDLSTENEETNENAKVDKEQLKILIEQYSLGINRVDTIFDTKESNTILLFIAKKYFDTQASQASLNIDTKYAQTAQNYHKYLSELTGKKYTNLESFNTFTNYIAYSPKNKSYVLGKNSSTITKENYVCTAIDVISKNDDVYTGKAIVTRTVDDVKTVYQLTFEFKINQDYEYQKYNIISLNAINSSFYPDNTVHLESN